MKEKNIYLDEETREDNAEPRLAAVKTSAISECPHTREECLYV